MANSQFTCLIILGLAVLGALAQPDVESYDDGSFTGSDDFVHENRHPLFTEAVDEMQDPAKRQKLEHKVEESLSWVARMLPPPWGGKAVAMEALASPSDTFVSGAEEAMQDPKHQAQVAEAEDVVSRSVPFVPGPARLASEKLTNPLKLAAKKAEAELKEAFTPKIKYVKADDSDMRDADSIAQELAKQERRSEAAVRDPSAKEVVRHTVTDELIQEDSEEAQAYVMPLPSLAEMTYRVHPMAVPVRYAEHLVSKAHDAVSETPAEGDMHPLFTSVVDRVHQVSSNPRLVAKAKRLSRFARGLPHPGAGASVLLQWGGWFGGSKSAKKAVAKKEAKTKGKKPVAKKAVAKKSAKKVVAKKEAKTKGKKAAKGLTAVSKLLYSKAKAKVAYTTAAAKKLIEQVSNDVSGAAARREYSRIVKAKVKAKLNAKVLRRKKEAARAELATQKAIKDRQHAKIEAQALEKKHTLEVEGAIQHHLLKAQAFAADKQRKLEEVKAAKVKAQAKVQKKHDAAKAQIYANAQKAQDQRAKRARAVAREGIAQKQKVAEQAVEATKAAAEKAHELAEEKEKDKNARAAESAAASKYVADRQEEIQKLKTEAAKAEEHTEQLHAEETSTMRKQIAQEQQHAAKKAKKQVDAYKQVKKQSQSLEKEAAETGEKVEDWRKMAAEEAKQQAQKLAKTLAKKRHEKASTEFAEAVNEEDAAEEAAEEIELEDATERGDAVDSLIARANRVLHPKTAEFVDQVLNKAKGELEAVQEPPAKHDDEEIDIDLVAAQAPAVDHDPDVDMEQMLPKPEDIAATPGVLVRKEDDGSVDVEDLHAKMDETLLSE